jgi:hypothetical protein
MRSRGGKALRLGEFLVRRAVRRLPPEIRDEWFWRFAGELPAILDDPAARSAFRRHARMLLCAADSIRGVWGLRWMLPGAAPKPVRLTSAAVAVGAAVSVGSATVLVVTVITADIRVALALSAVIFGILMLISAVLFARVAVARLRRASFRDCTPPGGG